MEGAGEHDAEIHEGGSSSWIVALCSPAIGGRVEGAREHDAAIHEGIVANRGSLVDRCNRKLKHSTAKKVQLYLPPEIQG